MRRSSRIQTKKQGNAADQKSERTKPSKSPRASRLPARTMKVLSPKRNASQNTGQQHNKLVPRKQCFQQHTKSDGKAQNRSNSSGKTTQSTPASSSPDEAKLENIQKDPEVDAKQMKSNKKATVRGKPAKNELSIPLLIQEDSDDSILSDVANSLKIDRTIKNLSPRKFFHNKDPKTTRSGRNFSPYDFASYSALFGAICAKQNKPKAGNGTGGSAANKENFQGVLANKHNKHKRGRRERGERSKTAKMPKKQNIKSRKMAVAPPEELEELREVDNVTVRTNEVFVRAEKPQTNKVVDEFEDDLFSEKVPESFWFDFPYPRSPNVDDHRLGAEFWVSGIVQSAAVAGWEEGKDQYVVPKKLSPEEMSDLSKVSLADADNYEFKSAFKDVSSQMANFEDSCGEWKPSPAYGKFDVMEAESAQGIKRFYRKRITDTGLIAWHKYNIVSSTKYCPESDVPTVRPVIKVRSNQCPKADLVWRLSQTQPPPSIDDVLNGAVVTLQVPKLAKK